MEHLPPPSPSQLARTGGEDLTIFNENVPFSDQRPPPRAAALAARPRLAEDEDFNDVRHDPDFDDQAEFQRDYKRAARSRRKATLEDEERSEDEFYLAAFPEPERPERAE